MQHIIDVHIALSRDEVVRLFENAENLVKWQPGFIGAEILWGNSHKVGCKTRLSYLLNNREIEMIETVVLNDLPFRFKADYDIKGAKHSVIHSFQSVYEDQTLWNCQIDFHFKGVMKIISAVLPGLINKQMEEFMHLFKEFAEEATFNASGSKNS